MNKMRKVFVLVLVAAIVSLGFMGCKDNGEHEHPAGEHPKSEHPTEEGSKSEHPTEEGSTSEHPASEHPAGEHPK